MKKSPNLRVQLAPRHVKGLALSNPVMIAAGIAGYGTEYAEIVDIQKLGAIVCKGTTPRPRKGNAQPRLVETAGGLLNSVGLENIGVDALIKEKAPIWARWRVPVIVNVAGETIDEYAVACSVANRVRMDDLLALMSNRELARDVELPSTGVPLDWERALSSIQSRANGYGTRATTALTVRADGLVSFVERSFDVEDPERWSDRQFEFMIDTASRPARLKAPDSN